MSPEAVLILGGQGYVGGALAAHLLAAGFDVRSVDAGIRGAPGPAPDDRRRYQDLSADELGRYGTVVLLAGHSGVSACATDPAGSFANNVTGFVELVHKLRGQRFVYASSVSVHAGATGVTGSDDPLPAPVALYDLHKQTIERYARLVRPDSYGLRFGSVAGPAPNVRPELLLNSLVRSAVRHGRVEVANPRAHRPVLGIGDLCRAVEAILTRPVPPGCYDLASANVRIGELAARVAERFGASLIEIESPTPYDLRVASERFCRAAGFAFTDTIEALTGALADHFGADRT